MNQHPVSTRSIFPFRAFGVARALWKASASDRWNLRKALVGIGVSVTFLFLVVRNISLGDVLVHLSRTRWEFLALAMVAGVGMTWVRGVRWRYLFHPDLPPSWPLASATMIGYMANNLLPLRAGELVRGYLVAKNGRLAFLTVMATIAIERILDVLAVLMILGAVVYLVPVPPILRQGALALLIVDLLAMGVLMVLANVPNRTTRWFRGTLIHFPKIERWLGHLSMGGRCLTLGPHLVPFVVWSVVLWGVNVGGIWLAIVSANLAVPSSSALTLLAFTGVGVSLPSGPGYIGNVQFFVVSALAIYGITGAEAVSFSFLLHAASFIPVTVTGLILVVIQQVSLLQASRHASWAARAPSESRHLR